MFHTLKNTTSSFYTYFFSNYFDKVNYEQNQLICFQYFSLFFILTFNLLKEYLDYKIFCGVDRFRCRTTLSILNVKEKIVLNTHTKSTIKMINISSLESGNYSVSISNNNAFSTQILIKK